MKKRILNAIKMVALVLFGMVFTTNSFGQTIDKDSILVFVGDVSSVSLLKEGSVSPIEYDTIESYNPNLKQLVIGVISQKKNTFSVESKISKRLFGKYKSKSIKFNLYDEFDYPQIKDFNHALYILKKNKDNNWNQVRWLYYDVYETTKGDWIIPYFSCPEARGFFESNKQLIELKKGEYIKKSFFDKYKGISEQELLKYYKIEGDNAIPIYGISVDLFWQYFSKEWMPKRFD